MDLVRVLMILRWLIRYSAEEKVMQFFFKIVGLKYQNFSPQVNEIIRSSNLEFKRDKKNVVDYYAVAAYLNGRQIGFVEREFSRAMSCVLDSHIDFVFQISVVNKLWIGIDCLLPELEDLTFPDISFLPNAPGVYALNFTYADGTEANFIGQSVNVRRRVNQHFTKLKEFKHHSYPLQLTWFLNYKNLKIVLLEEVHGETEAEVAELLLLFEDDYIRKSANALNIAEAELSDSEGGLSLVDSEFKSLKRNAAKVRKTLSSKKNAIGELAIKIKLFESIWPRSESPLTASNVLTWLKKRKRSPLDWVPSVQTNHDLYYPIKTSLQKLTEKIREIGADIRTVESLVAKRSLSGPKSKGIGVEALDEIRTLAATYEEVAKDSEAEKLVGLLVHPKLLPFL
mgnify:CR=1 FL=1